MKRQWRRLAAVAAVAVGFPLLRDRRFLVPEFGDIPVRSVAHQDELRGRFTEANRSPVPFRFDG